METIVNIILLMIFLNMGIGMMSQAFNYDLPNGLPLYGMAQEQENNINQVEAESNSAFSTVFIFGDYVKALQFFVNSFTGGYLWSTLDLIGVNFHPFFIMGLQAIWGVIVVYTFVYLISGRGTKSSI